MPVPYEEAVLFIFLIGKLLSNDKKELECCHKIARKIGGVEKLLDNEGSRKINELFLEMLTKVYEIGIGEKEMSVNQLLSEIENDLRKIVGN
ncbi:hypothetical protein V7129_13415 [Cytobacillus firmus]